MYCKQRRRWDEILGRISIFLEKRKAHVFVLNIVLRHCLNLPNEHTQRTDQRDCTKLHNKSAQHPSQTNCNTVI